MMSRGLTWTTEQGGHAPIILATGLWLLWRESRGVEVRPPRGLGQPWCLLVPLLVVFGVARITGILEIEAFAMYALHGGRGLCDGRRQDDPRRCGFRSSISRWPCRRRTPSSRP